MRVPSPTAPLVPAVALALVPAAIITVVMALVLFAAPHLGLAGQFALLDAAVLANLALWFAFSPAYLVGWVMYFDPQIRARTGMLGVLALACVLWFVNLVVYAGTGGLLGALLRG